METANTRPQFRIKSVALPAEHGGWGFFMEPVLLGLLIVPSIVGVLLGIAAFGAFLSRQPLKIALLDRRRGKRYLRTGYAERFAAFYLVTALIALAAAVRFGGFDLLLPLVIGVPFGIVQIIFDATGSSRDWLPELAGPAALATVSSSIAVAGGWAFWPALALWAIVIVRAIPSVLYVRARLKLEKGKEARIMPAIVTSLVGVVVLALLALAKSVPWLAVVVGVILLARAAYGLSKYRRPAAPKIIGFQEIAFGLMMAVLVAAGYAYSI